MNKSDYLYTHAGGFCYPLIPRKSVTKDKLYEWDGEKFVPYPKDGDAKSKTTKTPSPQ